MKTQDSVIEEKRIRENLKELYGNAYNVVLEKITKQLEEFSYHESIGNFVKILNQ